MFRVGERMAGMRAVFRSRLEGEVGGARSGLAGHRLSNDEAQKGGDGGLREDGEGFLPHSRQQRAVPRPVFHVCALSSSPSAFPTFTEPHNNPVPKSRHFPSFPRGKQRTAGVSAMAKVAGTRPGS